MRSRFRRHTLSLMHEAQRIASIEDVVRDRHVILVGGQPVSVWIGQLEDRLGARLTSARLRQMRKRIRSLREGVAEERPVADV